MKPRAELKNSAKFF